MDAAALQLPHIAVVEWPHVLRRWDAMPAFGDFEPLGGMERNGPVGATNLACHH